jgi:hypothetical protein
MLTTTFSSQSRTSKITFKELLQPPLETTVPKKVQLLGTFFGMLLITGHDMIQPESLNDSSSLDSDLYALVVFFQRS